MISECGKFRYHLTRIWDPSAPKLGILGLNCSTADAVKDDRTICREMAFARRMGFGSLYKGNLFAFRATDPKKMKLAEDPIGPENDMWIKGIAGTVEKLVVAWGTHGTFKNRDREVYKLLHPMKLWCFGVTKDGHPKHPLYLLGDTPLVPWTPPWI
jgi:hypothetical protein